MANSAQGNQFIVGQQLDVTVSPQPVAQNDSITQAISKLQAQAFELGAGNYIGSWDAATNTPNLSNSTIETAGNWYNVIISTGASSAAVDFGAGPITFTPSDAVYSNGAVYGKRDLPNTSIQLADAQILIGQTNGLAAPKPVTGDIGIDDTGNTTLIFSTVVNSPAAFDPTKRGGALQPFNADQSIDINTMITGRIYKLQNIDAVNTRAITFTGSAGITLVGGDALTGALAQQFNPGGVYTFIKQNALTVLIGWA